jgi:hypothetical protein
VPQAPRAPCPMASTRSATRWPAPCRACRRSCATSTPCGRLPCRLRGRPPRQEAAQDDSAGRAPARADAGGVRGRGRAPPAGATHRHPRLRRPDADPGAVERGAFPRELRRLDHLLVRGLAATAALWPPVELAFGWVHRAAHILGNDLAHVFGAARRYERRTTGRKWPPPPWSCAGRCASRPPSLPSGAPGPSVSPTSSCAARRPARGPRVRGELAHRHEPPRGAPRPAPLPAPAGGLPRGPRRPPAPVRFAGPEGARGSTSSVEGTRRPVCRAVWPMALLSAVEQSMWRPPGGALGAAPPARARPSAPPDGACSERRKAEAAPSSTHSTATQFRPSTRMRSTRGPPAPAAWASRSAVADAPTVGPGPPVRVALRPPGEAQPALAAPQAVLEEVLHPGVAPGPVGVEGPASADRVTQHRREERRVRDGLPAGGALTEVVRLAGEQLGHVGVRTLDPVLPVVVPAAPAPRASASSGAGTERVLRSRPRHRWP